MEIANRCSVRTHLQERMPRDDGQKAFQALPPRLDNLLREAVGEDLARKRRDVHARGLALKDVTEGFEVGVAPPYGGVPQFERRDVGLETDVRAFDPPRQDRVAPCTQSRNLCTSSVQTLHHGDFVSPRRHTREAEDGPCVCGLRTSISRKLSGTLYISSIYTRRSAGAHVRCTKGSLTVCSRPPRRGSSKTLLRANGETVVIAVNVVQDGEGGGDGGR